MAGLCECYGGAASSRVARAPSAMMIANAGRGDDSLLVFYSCDHSTPTTQMSLPSRADALALMHEYTASESLRKHMLSVEAAMRAYADKFNEDPERWGLAGLIHDFDYERFPNAAHSATEEHPAEGVRILRSKGFPEDILQAILGHATYCNVPRETRMAKALFAVDELTGLITARAL